MLKPTEKKSAYCFDGLFFGEITINNVFACLSTWVSKGQSSGSVRVFGTVNPVKKNSVKNHFPALRLKKKISGFLIISALPSITSSPTSNPKVKSAGSAAM